MSTWTFDALDAGKTKVTIRMVFPSAADRDFIVKEFGAIEGGKQTLERLSEHLPAMICREFVVTREFSAPRDQVWQAWTEADRLQHWFGPKGVTILAAKMDFRPGGIFHYCMLSPDGNKVWGRFAYREIVAPERLVWVNSFANEAGELARPPFSEAWPSEMLTTLTLTERDGKTTVTLRWVPIDATEEERKIFDSNHDSMNQGWSGTMEQLNEYLAKA
jgi:uncharacterized protein YndB with AHSA1/START domain